MQLMYREQPPRPTDPRRSWLDLGAAGLLLATVILHLVAMFPRYFGGSLDQGSAWSQPDQAALYSVLTAGWALALGLVLAGRAQVRLGEAVAVGLAVTELGFRVADVGEALHYGVGSSSVGMWLMTAAWVIGAAGAGVAVLAARGQGHADAVEAEPAPAPLPISTAPADPLAPPETGPGWGSTQPDPGWAAQWDRGRQPGPGWTAPPGPEPRPAVAARPAPYLDRDPDPLSVWAPSTSMPGVAAGAAPADADPMNVAEPTAHTASAPAASDPAASDPAASDPAASAPADPARAAPATVPSAGPVAGDVTGVIPVEPTAPFAIDPTSAVPVGTRAGAPSDAAPSGPYGVRPTLLVVALALITAGAFLPAWDRYKGVVTTTGRSVSFSLGNAFSGPWPLILGNVLAALALVAVPVLATRFRDRTVAALLVVGSLLVLASQFTSAIVQANQAVPPSVAGLTPAQSEELGLQLHLSLTGWFTLDVLAAYGLFVAVMVIGYLRLATAQENSTGTWPSAPEARSPASLPWS